MYERTLKEQFISTFNYLFIFYFQYRLFPANLPVSKTAFIQSFWPK